MLCLGKLPPKPHSKTLTLDKYILASALPPPPEKRAWEYSVPADQWTYLGNNLAGNCVEAAMLHYIQAARAYRGKSVTFTEKNALDLYSAITGYDGTAATDNGTAWTDALSYWQTTGVPLPDGSVDKILAWASIGLDAQSLNQGIDIFDGILVGTNVVQSMIDQFNDGKPWNAPFGGNYLGGHGIPALGFGREGRTVVTWAHLQQSDLTFPTQWDEAYVVIDQQWLDENADNPIHLNMSELQADIKLISA